jgi:hypothetical protein
MTSRLAHRCSCPWAPRGSGIGAARRRHPHASARAAPAPGSAAARACSSRRSLTRLLVGQRQSLAFASGKEWIAVLRGLYVAGGTSRLHCPPREGSSVERPCAAVRSWGGAEREPGARPRLACPCHRLSRYLSAGFPESIAVGSAWPVATPRVLFVPLPHAAGLRARDSLACTRSLTVAARAALLLAVEPASPPLTAPDLPRIEQTTVRGGRPRPTRGASGASRRRRDGLRHSRSSSARLVDQGDARSNASAPR